MDKEKNPFKWFKKRDPNNEHADSKSGKYQYLILVALIGAGIMLISNMLFKEDASTTNPSVIQASSEPSGEDVETFGQKSEEGNDYISKYERAYENQLKEALDTIAGVDDVTVVVNVDATEKKVMEKNTKMQSQTTDETDRDGGKRKVEDQSSEEELVTIQNGDKEVPIVIETKKPEIRGVLVVAKGAENITVKKWIIEAVTRALDVPSHRVSVMPKKTKGDS